MKLIIDGKEIEAKEELKLLDVARSAGIYIPTLCSHESLTPYGGCRLCIVEIEGMEGVTTACTTLAEDGMVVRTNTPTIQELRRRILELILSEHPYTCLICELRDGCKEYQYTIRKAGVTTGCGFCPKNGRCELQTVVERIGIDKVDFPVNYRSIPVEKGDPFYVRDYNLCILCGRCVRVCNEVRRNGAIAFIYRGSSALVGTAFGKSHIEANCVFCGSCVDVCPTGALTDKLNKWEGTPEYVVNTTCPYCGIGCQLTLHIKANRVIGSTPVKLDEVCLRGRFCISEIVHSPNRIKKPLIRKNDILVETSWDNALNVIADKLPNYKGKQFAFVVSPQCTNEDIYIFKKFTHEVMESDNILVQNHTQLPKITSCNLIGAYNIIGNLGDEQIFKLISSEKVKTLYLTAPIASYFANPRQVNSFLKDVEFLVVQSVFPIPEMEFANIVLPASSFAEVDGSFTNVEGKILQLHKAIDPLYHSKPDWWIVCEIAKRMGINNGFEVKRTQEISKLVDSLVVDSVDKLAQEPKTSRDIRPGDGFYYYRGCSLIDEVKDLRKVVEHWSKNV